MLAQELPIIIDVEASGFGNGSYPIEVGLILADGQTYCSLIKPEEDWTHWDKLAESLHCVSQQTLLDFGKDAIQVATQLNEMLQGKTVYSDAWANDMAWISLLYDRVELPQLFTIETLVKILSEEQQQLWGRAKNQVMVELELKRHRASSDARIIQMAYKQTLTSLD
jgi:hypothetical protein